MFVMFIFLVPFSLTCVMLGHFNVSFNYYFSELVSSVNTFVNTVALYRVHIYERHAIFCFAIALRGLCGHAKFAKRGIYEDLARASQRNRKQTENRVVAKFAKSRK